MKQTQTTVIPAPRQPTIAYRGREPASQQHSRMLHHTDSRLVLGGAIGAKNINIKWPYFK